MSEPSRTEHSEGREVEEERQPLPEAIAEPPNPPEQRFYANALYANGGPYDVSLDFGYRAGEEAIEPQVRVAMSYEHLRSVIALLERLLENYETTVGKVPDPAAERQGT